MQKKCRDTLRERPNWATIGLQHKAKSPETQSFQGFSLAQMERFELSHRLSQSTPLAGEPLEPLGYICICGYDQPSRLSESWRRERDSNPRCLSTSLVFKTSALNRSAISPFGPFRRQAPCWAALSETTDIIGTSLIIISRRIKIVKP